MIGENETMKIKDDRKNVDFSQPLYRGILSEIARERGVSRQAIQASFRRGNHLIVQAVATKARERKQRR